MIFSYNILTEFYVMINKRFSSRDKNVKLIVRLLYQACLYLIWRERNSRIHSGNTRQLGALIAEIKQLIRLRFNLLSRAQVLKQGEISVFSAWFAVF
ncbi:hypothetical protein Bca4012_006550 [Brassica carinata]